MYLKTTCKSQCLMRAVTFSVILPYHDGYAPIDAPFKTLYFLPGFSANAEEIIACFPWRRFVHEYGVAVLIPDGENSFYSNQPARAAMFGDFVGAELVELTRRLFPQLSHKREDTFIGGISMGGYGALIHGLRRHDAFSRIMMMSPVADVCKLLTTSDPGIPGAVPATLLDSLFGGKEAYLSGWTNPYYSIREMKENGTAFPKLFLCCGKQDVLVYDSCSELRACLEENHIPVEYHEDCGGHDVIYWDGKLDAGFRFLTKA